MLRSLFRRQRSVRVPLENGGITHSVREVKIYRREISKPSNFITTFFLAYFFFRLVETYTSGTEEGTISSKEKWEARKSQTPNSQALQQSHQPSEHWKKAHDAIRKSNPDTNLKPTPNELSDKTHTSTDGIATIAIPVWFRERKRGQWYQPEDPEFREFVRIQSDPKKIASLKKQVESMVIASLKGPPHRGFLQRIGFTGQVTIRTELMPQLGPPPTYEIPALTVYKDGIGLDWKALRPEVGSRMESILRPSIAFAAAKASASVFFQISWGITKAKLFGGNMPDIVRQYEAHQNQIKSAVSQKELEKNNTIPAESHRPATSQELLRAVHQGLLKRNWELIDSLPFPLAVKAAAVNFRLIQVRAQAAAQVKRARGSMQVRGTLVSIGESANYRMEFYATYLPSEDIFLKPITIYAAYVVKDYSKWQQIEEKKKKALQKKTSQRHLLDQQTIAEEPSRDTQKPPTGKEKD